MTEENHRQECIHTLRRIETLVSSIEEKLTEIDEDLRSDLDALRQREFWDDYSRYMDGGR